MDRFKEKMRYDYTSWDIGCRYNSRNWNKRINKLKNIFRRKARKKLKQELSKEIKGENNE